MKKLIKNKTFIVGALAFLCVAITVVCVLWSSGGASDFTPDPTVSIDPVNNWTENPSQSASDKAADDDGYLPVVWQPIDGQNGQSEKPTEEYPKVVEENKDEVVIDFTDPELPAKDPPPETPNSDAVDGKTDHTPPKTPADTDKPKENQNPSNPKPGSVNEKGEFYDPVFGWVKPGNVEQVEIGGDGDPNKIIGSMN